jgi:hypothetical protein
VLVYTVAKATQTASETRSPLPVSGMEAALTPWQGLGLNTRMWGSGHEAARINYGVGGTWGWAAYREDGFRIASGSARTQGDARRRVDQILTSYRPRSTGVYGVHEGKIVQRVQGALGTSYVGRL